MIKNILIDFKRTIYDPDTDSLLAGALEGLNMFRDLGLHIRLVGKGTETETLALLGRHGIRSFFDEAYIDEDKEKFFEVAGDPASWLVIGDRAHKEIAFGKRRGMKAIWLKQGKFSEEGPMSKREKPDYTVSSWREIMGIVRNEVN